ATSATGIATLRVNSLPASSGSPYALWVDSADLAGPFTLSATLSGPVSEVSGDTCAAPLALALGTPVSGSTATAQDDYELVSGACAAGQWLGAALVYAF